MATGEFDLLLGDVHSLKEKRAIVRPLVADLRRRYHVAVAEVGNADLHRRAVIGVAAVADDASAAQRTVAQCERFIAQRPEFDLLSAGLRVFEPSGDFSAPRGAPPGAPRRNDPSLGE